MSSTSMSSTPPVPPRPAESYEHVSHNAPPPIPPLPPNFRPDSADPVLAPHFENPLIAPRPHKMNPEIPANMVRQLDDQLSHNAHYHQRTQGPHPPPPPPPPSFAMPSPMATPDDPRGYPMPAGGGDWSPWAVAVASGPGYPQPYAQQQYRNSHFPQSSVDSFASMSLSPQPYPPARPSSAYPPSAQPSSPHPAHRNPSGPRPQSPPRQPSATMGQPSLTVPLPTIPILTAALPAIQRPGRDPSHAPQAVAWARDVLALVERAHQLHSSSADAPNVNSTDIPVGPVRIGDAQLQRLVDVAIPLILELSSPQPMPSPMPPHVAEAIYLRATCEASGAYPQVVPHNPRTAFRDFEQAAKSGHYAAWFKLGRDYENFGDAGHARDCFDRGVKHGVESCLYRMGMAHLMGQLGLPSTPEIALPLLQRAATLASVDVPQPAYVYGLLLLAEFSHIQLPPYLFNPLIPPGSTAHVEARKHLERAAYLNFAPAQYKLGHSYEYATPPFPFDALLSVQYYSLASQQGEVEADMALSKWFLCGAEGSFEKDESLAWTFADKAARKGLPSAEFAMGYYAEVGVGGPKDIESARKWYTRAAEHGNADAKERFQALSQPTPQALSRDEHKTLTDSTLVRKRTQAKQRSDASGAFAGRSSAAQTTQIMENVRKNSLMGRPAPNAVAGSSRAAAYSDSANVTSSPPDMGRPARLPAVDGLRTPGASPKGGQQPLPGSSMPQHPAPHGAPFPQQPLPGPGNSGNSTNPRLRSSQPSQPQPQGPPPGSHPGSPAPGGQRPFANAPRYSLMDPGSGSAPGPRPGIPNSPTPAGTPPLRRTGKTPAPDGGPGFPGQGGGGGPAASPRPPGPQTFAEMGIAGTKVEDEGCVVM